MAFGDLPLDAPCKPNKGKEGGACNRQSCQAEPALHFNHGSYAWYCGDCARDIGGDIVNRQSWLLHNYPKCGHAMFETREEIDAREAAAKAVEPPAPPAPPSYADFFHAGYRPAKSKSSSLQRMLKAGRRRV
ncbi:hypothetical protein [Sphingomonas sp. 3-13AW]|uniref:hypothetical protein n=1 Tax=Sphingomonas sp. 3-13AW TaxID=3050450 RepID=UPI003BB57A9B